MHGRPHDARMADDHAETSHCERIGLLCFLVWGLIIGGLVLWLIWPTLAAFIGGWLF